MTFEMPPEAPVAKDALVEEENRSRRLVEQINTLLDNGLPYERQFALGGMLWVPYDERAPLILKALTNDDPETRLVALGYLPFIDHERREECAITAIADSDPRVRRSIVKYAFLCFDTYRQPHTYVDFVSRALDDVDSGVQLAAINDLSNIIFGRPEDSVLLVKKAIGIANPEMRRALADVVRNTSDRSKKILMDALTAEEQRIFSY